MESISLINITINGQLIKKKLNQKTIPLTEVASRLYIDVYLMVKLYLCLDTLR